MRPEKYTIVSHGRLREEVASRSYLAYEDLKCCSRPLFVK